MAPLASKRIKVFSISAVGNDKRCASGEAVSGPLCIVQPVTRDKTASSWVISANEIAGGVSSSAASG